MSQSVRDGLQGSFGEPSGLGPCPGVLLWSPLNCSPHSGFSINPFRSAPSVEKTRLYGFTLVVLQPFQPTMHMKRKKQTSTGLRIRSLPTVFCGAEFFLPRRQTDAICASCHGDREPESVSNSRVLWKRPNPQQSAVAPLFRAAPESGATGTRIGLLFNNKRNLRAADDPGTNTVTPSQLWSKDRALSMSAHGRWRLPARAPIGLRHRPRAVPTPSARAESDRVACLCPSATVHICNPRMSRAARQDVPSASRRSSLGPANAQRLLSNDRVG